MNGEDVSNQRTERILTKLQEEMKKAALTGGEAKSSDLTLVFARHWQGLNNKSMGHGFGLHVGARSHDLYNWEHFHEDDLQDDTEDGHDGSAVDAIAAANATKLAGSWIFHFNKSCSC